MNLRWGYDNIIGLAPNLANKIQAKSVANSVTVAESTYDLAHSLFHMIPLPSIQLQNGGDRSKRLAGNQGAPF